MDVIIIMSERVNELSKSDVTAIMISNVEYLHPKRSLLRSQEHPRGPHPVRLEWFPKPHRLWNGIRIRFQSSEPLLERALMCF